MCDIVIILYLPKFIVSSFFPTESHNQKLNSFCSKQKASGKLIFKALAIISTWHFSHTSFSLFWNVFHPIWGVWEFLLPFITLLGEWQASFLVITQLHLLMDIFILFHKILGCCSAKKKKKRIMIIASASFRCFCLLLSFCT